MNKGERRSLRMQNMKQLRDLGLPTDLFSDGFWEREAVAKKRELALLAEFERCVLEGYWDHLQLPFGQIIQRWRDEIARPMHFASIAPNLRWVPVMGDAATDWRRSSNGSFRKTW
jgi:hypothetical protein